MKNTSDNIIMKLLLYYVLVSVTLYDVVVLYRINKHKKIKIKRHKENVSENISEKVKPREEISVEVLLVPSTTDYASSTKPPRVLIEVPVLPPYFGFLTNICKVLISKKFNEEPLKKYILILSNSLKGLGINYLQKLWIKRLRKTLKKYHSKYGANRIKTKVNDFLVFISDGKPKKKEYFKAMDAIYTVVDDMRMDEYIYFLKRYGKGDLKHIGENTRRVFERILFFRFDQQPSDVKKYIELKFTSAVAEYWEERLNGTAFNFTLGHLFNYTLSQPKN